MIGRNDVGLYCITSESHFWSAAIRAGSSIISFVVEDAAVVMLLLLSFARGYVCIFSVVIGMVDVVERCQIMQHQERL